MSPSHQSATWLMSIYERRESAPELGAQETSEATGGNVPRAD